MRNSMFGPSLLLAAFAAGAGAQTGSLTGRITERSTGRPIEGASVVVRGTAYGVKTTADGNYTILGVPPGTYAVEARRTGFQTMEVVGVVVSVNARRVQNIEMTTAQPRIVEPGTAARMTSTTTRSGTGAQSQTLVTEPGVVTTPFEANLVPPELVMQHQREIELTNEQRTAITDAVKRLQSQTVDLQWNLQAEQTALSELLSRRPVDERAVIAQLNRMLELEASVKRAHLATLVSIKNTLTERQFTQLQAFRGSGWIAR